MSRSNIIIVVLIVVVSGGLLLWMYLSYKSHHLWVYTADIEAAEPYDYGLFFELLKDRNDAEMIHMSAPASEWKTDRSEKSLLIYDSQGMNSWAIGPSSGDSTHRYHLDSLLRSGHHALVMNMTQSNVYRWLPFLYHDSTYTAMKLVIKEGDSSWIPSRSILYDIDSSDIHSQYLPTGSTAEFHYAVKNDTIVKKDWLEPYISRKDLDARFPDAEVVSVLMGQPDKVVAFDVPFGEGVVHFVLAGCHFTNYSLNTRSNFAYVSDYSDRLPTGDLILDEYVYYNSSKGSNNHQGLERSPLSFLLSFPSLRWAWYVLLTSIGLFLLFRTQRRQRIVPVINERKNQSLEFARSLGILQYRISPTHNMLGKEIIRQFRNWSKRRFRNDGVLNDDYKKQLISMLPEIEADLHTFFNLAERLQNGRFDINADELNRIYSITRYIYEHV